MRIILALVVAACSSKSAKPPEQSFHDGVQALCDLPSHVPAPTTDSYEKRLAAVADWAEHNITNAEARQVGSIKSVGANKDALAAAVAKAGVQDCRLLDNGMELQSFADAMKTVCEADARDPVYFKSHMLNTEVIRLVESLGDASPTDRQQRMRDAVARAKLTSCAMLDRSSAIDHKVPTVPDVGLVEAEPAATATITPSSIVVEGKAVVAVTNGDVDPAEKEGGAVGLKIPRLTTFATALATELNTKTPGSTLVMTLVVDPATPYKLFMEALVSIKAAGFRTFKLAVHAGTALKAIPLELPDKTPPGTPREGLGMVVSITKDKLVVWSLSGTEGSLQKPALDVALDHVADVQKALAAIRDKHFHDKRTPADREIIVMADSAISMQRLAEVLVAVHTTPDGKELFPSTLLSSGFE